MDQFILSQESYFQAKILTLQENVLQELSTPSSLLLSVGADLQQVKGTMAA